MATVSWSRFVDALKYSSKNPQQVELWLYKYNLVAGPEAYKKNYNRKTSFSSDFSNHLLFNLSRARSQIQQANLWRDPMIGNPEKPTSLAKTRGLIWRYVIAYSGWENCTKKLLITQKLQVQFFDEKTSLYPPHLNPTQKNSLAKWLGLSAEQLEADDAELDSRNLNGFLSITTEDYKSFPDWLIGRETELSQPQILAIMRNMVAHGSLLPTKAERWGLTPLYARGPAVINRCFHKLLVKLYPFD